MAKLTGITITDLIDKGLIDLYRLQFADSAHSKYCKGFREFSAYCETNNIAIYDEHIAINYLLAQFDVDVTDLKRELTQKQLDARCTLRLLDDVYQFGYARRNHHRDYRMPSVYDEMLENYMEKCKRDGNSAGTRKVKRLKLREFFVFLHGRGVPIEELTSADISDFMVTLAGLSRVTINIYVSALRCFLQHLYEIGILSTDLSPAVPKPKLYAEESIPETWTTEELQTLLSSIDRTGGVGKRDYAMILLATMLGMRVGDICNLKFENCDWHRKLITYTQQKTGKVNVLPILPVVMDALVDYLKNGRIETESKNIFVQHIAPYGEFKSSSGPSCQLKKYMSRAGLEVKERKAMHSLRHTLASYLLSSRTPLTIIQNALGHDNPVTTLAYTKTDVPSLRECSLSYCGEAVQNG
ncbi:MAG: tyrosine-type recombinase/integrase [Clostridiales bacterium]|jgi:site-specific recombinase XerD|nr:tyrosine-type recombinase/integrase [Clostridiales bacterium]